MNEEEFWDLIEYIGWGTRTTDYNAVKKMLMRDLTHQQLDDLRAYVDQFSNRLSRFIDAEIYEKGDSLGLGDDGCSDLVYHVVGLGKKIYYDSLADATLLMDRAKSKYGSVDGFTESFAYAIPYKSDFENKNPQKYIDWAQKDIQAYQSMATMGKFTPIHHNAQLIVAALHTLIEGEWEKFVAQRDKIKAALHDIDAFCKNNSSSLIKYTPPNRWSVENMISDVEFYLL